MRKNNKFICHHYYEILRRELTHNGNGTQTERYEIKCQLCGHHMYESITTEIYSEVIYKEDNNNEYSND